jgi:chromate transporter
MNSPPATPAETALARPASSSELFFTFNRLALQGFGGVLAIAQHELVERQRWLTRQQFVEMLALSQVLPGPNVVNLALMLGDRFFGWRGALAAMGGMLLVPLVIVLVLTAAYAESASRSSPARGMGRSPPAWDRHRLQADGNAAQQPAASRSPRLLDRHLRHDPLLRWPLVWVLAGLGSLAIALAWRRWR